jgi:hypothetical protein
MKRHVWVAMLFLSALTIAAALGEEPKQQGYLEIHDKAAADKILKILAAQRGSRYRFTETKEVTYGALPVAEVEQVTRRVGVTPAMSSAYIHSSVTDFFGKTALTQIQAVLKTVDKSLYRLDVVTPGPARDPGTPVSRPISPPK